MTLFLLLFLPLSAHAEGPDEGGWEVCGWSERDNGRVYLALRNGSVVYPSLHLYVYTENPRNFTITINSDVLHTHVNFSSEYAFELRPGRNVIKVSDGNRTVSYSVISSSDIHEYLGPPSEEEQALIAKSYLYSESNVQGALAIFAGIAGVVLGYWRSYIKKMDDMEVLA